MSPTELNGRDGRLDRRLIVGVDRRTSDELDEICRREGKPISAFVRELIGRELKERGGRNVSDYGAGSQG